MATRAAELTTFGFKPGRIIGGKYAVQTLLGAGWEGEVYRVLERRTGAMRAAKLFFPNRNDRDKAVDFYAKKLEHLRSCSMVIQYHHMEHIRHRGVPTTVLISEFVEGRMLDRLIESRRGKRLPECEALLILHALASGLEQIHARREYHGDLHASNVLVRRIGVSFDVKVVDLFNWGRPSAANIREDVINCIRLFYDMLGGQRWYAAQRREIKGIICGLKHGLIGKRFPTAMHLRRYLDEFEWDSV